MDEIEKLKKEISQLKIINDNKSDIISITAHQLRTSLSAMKWIFKMFMEEDVGKLTSEQNELMQKAYVSNERMLALVNDLLTLSHSEDASVTYNFKKLNILHIIEQIMFEFFGETNKKGIELIFLPPEGSSFPANCDEEMLRVVVQNLIENAIKYSDKGGKIFVSLRQKDGNNIIAVHDLGIGIDDSDKDSIFKKFFRAKNAQEKDAVGSGLGLFTTKSIVEKHGGKIWFENALGGGTTFLVSLPIAK